MDAVPVSSVVPAIPMAVDFMNDRLDLMLKLFEFIPFVVSLEIKDNSNLEFIFK